MQGQEYYILYIDRGSTSTLPLPPLTTLALCSRVFMKRGCVGEPGTFIMHCSCCLIYILVCFVRACAPVRCAYPSFLAHCYAKRGAARPPPPVAASLLLIRPPKIYKIYRIWVAGVKGFFFQLSHRGQRVYRVPGLLSSRPNWVPPPPHPQESVAPPFGS
jgi:hypothetical protein